MADQNPPPERWRCAPKRSEYAAIKQIRAALHTAVEARNVQAVLRIGREQISPMAHGRDHTLWDAYYNAIRLTWQEPGAGYVARAITPRELTSEASRHHIPQFDNANSDASHG
jgi:hypothetical protein